MLEAREAVRKLKQYQPPLGDRSGLRLDFNENTGGCSPKVIERLRQLRPEQLACYPEREPVEREVASCLGLHPEQVLLLIEHVDVVDGLQVGAGLLAQIADRLVHAHLGA